MCVGRGKGRREGGEEEGGREEGRGSIIKNIMLFSLVPRPI